MTESESIQRLVQEIQQGRTEPLGAVCDYYRERLRRMIALKIDQRLSPRIGDSDVLQDVYLEAQRRIDEYMADAQVEFYVWLRGLAIQRLAKLSRDHLQTARRSVHREVSRTHHSSVLLAHHLTVQKSGPLSILLRREAEELVLNALERLPDELREVLAMRHFEEMSNREVAQTLGLSESGATRRYGRAVRELQRLIGASSPPGGTRP